MSGFENSVHKLHHHLSNEQLTEEQRKVYSEAYADYMMVLGSWVTEENEIIESYLRAFKGLIKYIDDVESENYLLLFAIVVQKLQDREFVFEDVVISKKIDIFLKFIKYYQYESTEDDFFEHLLDHLYINLGFILMEGEEHLDRNENVAYMMFRTAKNRGIESAGKILDQFSQDSDGKWYYEG